MQKISGKAVFFLCFTECHLDSAGSYSRIFRRFPPGLIFPLRDCSLCFTDHGFCVSDGFEARDSETCLLHTPSPSSSALTFTSWKHPGGLSQSSQGIWKSNYTALRENTENYKNTSVIRNEVTGSGVREWIFPINFPFRALFSTFLILSVCECFGNISCVFQKKRKPFINLLNLLTKQWLHPGCFGSL